MAHVSPVFSWAINRGRAKLECVNGRLAVVLGASALVACADPAGELALWQTQQPILAGRVDRTHPEVMLLASRAGSLCTGTVVHVAEQTGFLLTAAHCVTEEREGGLLVPLTVDQLSVVPGVNFAESTTEFLVDGVSVEPPTMAALARTSPWSASSSGTSLYPRCSVHSGPSRTRSPSTMSWSSWAMGRRSQMTPTRSGAE